MRKIAAFFFFIVTAVGLGAQTLSWDIKFLKGREQESLPISRTIRMETGEIFQISIAPVSDCYCYVVCYDSQRHIIVLYDQSLKGGYELFLDPVELKSPRGTETLYVIMSLERKTVLENLIQNHRSNPGSRQYSDNLYREVVRLQNEASGLGEPTSAFIASGGTTRGNAEGQVTRFADKALYVRAIAIRH